MNQFNYINIQKYAPPVRDQGATGACYAYALTGAMSYTLNLVGQNVGDLSPLYTYNKTLIQQGTPNVDAGSMPWAGTFIGSWYGFVPESEYSGALFDTPTAANDALANNIQIEHYQFFSITGATEGDYSFKSIVKEQLSHGLAPVLTYFLPNGGGHAVWIVGADETGIIFQNSWDTTWGNNGYGTMTYENAAANFNSLQVADKVSYSGVLYDNMWTDNTESITKLYNAILNRAPDNGGLTWAVSELEAGHSLGEIARGMFASEEFQSLIPGQDSVAALDAWMENTLFGHTSESFNVISNSIDYLAQYTVVMLSILDGDQRLENRADMGQLYAMAMHRNDVEQARIVLVGITDDAQSVANVFMGL